MAYAEDNNYIKVQITTKIYASKSHVCYMRKALLC